jgi:hypothetical protein
VQLVDYGVNKVWEMNNLGVKFSRPPFLSFVRLTLLDPWGR